MERLFLRLADQLPKWEGPIRLYVEWAPDGLLVLSTGSPVSEGGTEMGRWRQEGDQYVLTNKEGGRQEAKDVEEAAMKTLEFHAGLNHGSPTRP